MGISRFERMGGFAAAAITAGCAGSPAGPGGGPATFDDLFAPATSSDVSAVRSEWNGRNPLAADVRVEQVIATTFGTMTGQATVISHVVDGSRHYGALFVPAGAPQNAPIVVFLHASGNGVSIPQADTDFLIGGLGALRDDLAYVIPSYRSEELRVGGLTFRSEGDESPWDRDVDDALALLDAAIDVAPPGQLSPGRVATIGVSRGALVAMLMAARDSRIRGTIEIGGPTDFFGDYARDLIEATAAGTGPGLVGLSYLNRRFVQPWLRGEVSTATVRRELVRRSSVLFGSDLPRLQVHHGTGDAVVDVSQAEALIDEMTSLGRASPQFEGYLYPGSGHDITSLAAAPGRARAFLEELWFSASASADLRVSLSGPPQAAVGDTITYVISTRNLGPAGAEAVTLSDTLPGGVTFLGASSGATVANGVVRWPSLDVLASGSTRVDTLRVAVQGAGSLKGVAAVTAVTNDPNRADNTSSVTTSVSAPGPDLNALFASPTATEVAAVRSEWAMRNPRSINPSVEQVSSITVSGVSGRLGVLSHTVDGNRHYGAVFVPNRVRPGSAPIIVFAHAGDGGVAVPGTDLPYLVSMLAGLSRDFVYVLPSFRSEALTVGGNTYRSGGVPSPWDRDVDDALALIEVVIAIVPEADPSRIAVIGSSRGGGVAQLMAARDPRIDGVVEISGPTDFYDPWVRGIVANLVAGQPPQRAGMDAINHQIIQPWVRGTLPLADARRALIARSGVQFASSLPAFQLHHGTADPVVEVSQAQRMISAMNALGRTPPSFEAFLYQGGTHNRATLVGAPQRIRSFIAGLFP